MTDAITRLNELRLKVTEGEEITQEEAAEALQLLRSQRQAVLDVQQKKEAKSKPPMNLNDLFD